MIVGSLLALTGVLLLTQDQSKIEEEPVPVAICVSIFPSNS